MASSQFIHIGMNNVVQRDRVIAIIPINTSTGERVRAYAETKNRFIRATRGRKARALIIMDDGTVFSSFFNPRTLMGRFNGVMPEFQGEDEEDTEFDQEDAEDNESD